MPSGAVIQEERTDRNGTYKSLKSASAANANGIIWYRSDYELHWLRKLRKQSVKIGRLMNKCRTFAGYAALSRALVELCERERILLRIPLPKAVEPAVKTAQTAPTVYEINHATTSPHVMSEPATVAPSQPEGARLDQPS